MHYGIVTIAGTLYVQISTGSGDSEYLEPGQSKSVEHARSWTSTSCAYSRQIDVSFLIFTGLVQRLLKNPQVQEEYDDFLL